MRILKISQILIFASLAFLSISPSIEFANRSSTIALGSDTEFITAAGVDAWLQQSVVKDLPQGNISAATITYDDAPTDFIVNNSLDFKRLEKEVGLLWKKKKKKQK